MSKEINKYCEDKREELIEKLKDMVQGNMEIASRKIKSDESENGVLNGLKARRVAVEDAKWALLEIIDLANTDNKTEKSNNVSGSKSYWDKVAGRKE